MWITLDIRFGAERPQTGWRGGFRVCAGSLGRVELRCGHELILYMPAREGLGGWPVLLFLHT